MRLSFLEPLYKQTGPYASVYLDTSRDSALDDADATVELRWRRLRAALVSEGADQDSIAAAADAVGSDTDIPGMHGQAVFTAHLASVLRTMVLDGRGAAWLPETLIHDDLAAGLAGSW